MLTDAEHIKTGLQGTKCPVANLTAIWSPALSDNTRKAQSYDEPATLYRVMQDTIGRELRAHYGRPPPISHGLLVLLMQINEDKRRKAAPQSAGSARFPLPTSVATG